MAKDVRTGRQPTQHQKKKNLPNLWTCASMRQPNEEGFLVLFLHLAVRSTGPDVVLWWM
jgi:hypothetical protein